jgi:hypothetical protein
VSTAGSSVLVTVPWLKTSVTPAGTGLSMVRSNVTVAPVAPVAPVSPARPPSETSTGSSLSTVPCVVVTEPCTMEVCAGMRSWKTTPVAVTPPAF